MISRCGNPAASITYESVGIASGAASFCAHQQHWACHSAGRLRQCCLQCRAEAPHQYAAGLIDRGPKASAARNRKERDDAAERPAGDPQTAYIGGWHAAQVFDGSEYVVGLSLQPRDQYDANIAANSLAPGRPVGAAVAAPLRDQHGITGSDIVASEPHSRVGPPLKPGARPVVVDKGRERAGPVGLIEIALNA